MLGCMEQVRGMSLFCRNTRGFANGEPFDGSVRGKSHLSATKTFCPASNRHQDRHLSMSASGGFCMVFTLVGRVVEISRGAVLFVVGL